MAREIDDAVTAVNKTSRCGVIVLQGAGRAFCAGSDLKLYEEEDHQGEVWDPIQEFRMMKADTDHFHVNHLRAR
jgi:enoyl-CoA hydratase